MADFCDFIKTQKHEKPFKIFVNCVNNSMQSFWGVFSYSNNINSEISSLICIKNSYEQTKFWTIFNEFWLIYKKVMTLRNLNCIKNMKKCLKIYHTQSTKSQQLLNQLVRFIGSYRKMNKIFEFMFGRDFLLKFKNMRTIQNTRQFCKIFYAMLLRCFFRLEYHKLQ